MFFFLGGGGAYYRNFTALQTPTRLSLPNRPSLLGEIRQRSGDPKTWNNRTADRQKIAPNPKSLNYKNK